MDGIAIVVDETGKVASATPIVDDVKDDTAAKIAALEAENATLKQQLAEKAKAVDAQATASAKTVAEFQNALTEVKNELNKIKNTTFGDTSVPQDAADKKEANQKQIDPQLDAMARTMGQAFVSSRKF